MKLLPNEEQLLILNDKKIILTNYRIQKTDSGWGQSFSINIFLEDISSIEIKYKNDILFLILGPLIALGGFYFGGIAAIGGLFLGAIFIAIWWATRKSVILISSNGGSPISFTTQGMGKDKTKDFVHAILIAKHTRVNQLYKV